MQAVRDQIMADAALRLAEGAKPLGGGHVSRLASANPSAPFAKTSAAEALRSKLARKKEAGAEPEEVGPSLETESLPCASEGRRKRNLPPCHSRQTVG